MDTAATAITSVIPSIPLHYIAVGLMSFAMLGSALAIGNIFAALLTGISRNPEAESKMSKYAYVGAGFAESIGLLAAVIAFLLLLM